MTGPSENTDDHDPADTTPRQNDGSPPASDDAVNDTEDRYGEDESPA